MSKAPLLFKCISRIKWWQACVVVCAIAGVVLVARIAVPAGMHHSAIRRLERHGWSVHTVSAIPAWLPDMSGRLPEWTVGWIEGLSESVLEISGPPCDDDGASQHVGDFQACIPFLPEVRAIRLVGVTEPDRQASALRSCSQLQGLTLRMAPLGDKGLQALGNLSHLKYLDLSSTRITDAGLSALRDLHFLTVAELSSTGITGVGLADWPGRSMITLDLGNTMVTDSSVAHLRHFARLQRLVLNGTAITDVGIEHLLALSELEEICLNETAITSAGARRLADLRLLHSMMLGSTGVDDSVIATFADRLNVTDLDLADTRISDECVTDILRMPDLIQLNVSKTALSAASFCRLAKCPQLRWLVAEDTAITADGIEALLAVPQIEEIQLTSIQMKEQRIAKLAASSAGNRVLKTNPMSCEE